MLADATHAGVVAYPLQPPKALLLYAACCPEPYVFAQEGTDTSSPSTRCLSSCGKAATLENLVGSLLQSLLEQEVLDCLVLSPRRAGAARGHGGKSAGCSERMYGRG